MSNYAAGSIQPMPQRLFQTSTQYSYLTIPIPLAVDLQDTPLAVGLYSLIARQYVLTKAPVPLSAPDVLRYDPSISRGAVLRALARLIDGGWVIASQQPGYKTCYRPAWGYVLNNPRPWQSGAPLMGRPRRLSVLELDQRLLDTCMGKITLHPLRTALVERYFSRPLLGLADVGAYALTLAGYPAATALLCCLGLVRDGQIQPLRSDEELFALADDHGVTLSERGMRRFGRVPAPPQESISSAAQPLFFVPRPMIGKLIGTMIDPLIGHAQPDETALTASGRDETELQSSHRRSHGLYGNEGHEGSPPPSPQTAGEGGGGGEQDEQKKRPTSTQPTRGGDHERRCRHRGQKPCTSPTIKVPAIDTEAAQALRAINVLPAQVTELAELPIELIQAAIRDGQARPDVRDLAGWVVYLLRNARDHGWRIQPPTPRPDSPEALRAAFARYAVEQAEAAQEAPICSSSEPPASISPASADMLPRLWNEVLGDLQLQVSRQEFNAWLRCSALLAIEDGMATIRAPSVLAKEAIERRYTWALRDLLELHAGLSLVVRVVLHNGS